MLSLVVMGYGEIIIKNPDVASLSVRHCVVVSQGGKFQCESWAFAMCRFAQAIVSGASGKSQKKSVISVEIRAVSV